MAVTSVEKMWSSRGGTDTLLNHRTYRCQYEILVDDPDTSDQDIVNAVGVPQVGDQWPTDSGAYLVDFELSVSDESPFIWYFSAKYDSKPELPEAFDPGEAGAEPGDVSDNPLLRPPVWSVEFVTTAEPAERWYKANWDTGNLEATLSLVRNSADLPFDPPAMVEVCRPVIRVTKNVSPTTATLSFFCDLQDRVNDRTWRGLTKRQVRIGGVRGSGKKENGINFVEVSLDLMLKWDTWDLRILDAGYAEKTQRSVHPPPPAPVQNVTVWTQIKSPYGPFDGGGPYPLNGSGRLLAADGDPVYLRGLTKNYREADFATLLGI